MESMTVTHITYEQSTCSAPGYVHRNHWLSEFKSIVESGVDYVQRHAHLGNSAYFDIRFYSDEPMLQFTISIRTIWSGDRYPVTGYAIPKDTDSVEILIDEYYLEHPEFNEYLQKAISLMPKGSQLRMSRIRQSDIVEEL